MTRGQKGISPVGGSKGHRRTTLPRRVGRIAATLTTLLGLVVFALPAGAVEPIVIPVDTVVRGAEGEVYVLAEVATGSDAGCEAEVSAVSENNPSVHIGNDLIIASGDDSVVIDDVEASPGLVLSADGTLLLSDTIVVMVRLGPADEGRPNSIFSGGVTVSVTCIPQETTTTTEATTSSTEEETTTTTMATTTSTEGPREVTTTTTTTPPPSVLGTSTTTLPSSTTVPPVSGSTLPFTGPDQLAGTALAGGALILLGLAMMAAVREPQTTD